MSDATLGHLQRHHGDFGVFRDKMILSYRGRFDAVFWGVWDRWVHPTLPAEPTFLDLGTGPGTTLRDLLERYPSARAVGVDVQPAMLESAEALAADLGARARIVTADVANPPIPTLEEGAFDAVVVSFVLHEMHLPQQALAETARVLAPGGRVVVYDASRQPLRRYVDGALDGTVEQILHFAEHCRYTPEDFVFLAESAGLVPDEVLTRSGGSKTLMVLHKR